MRRHEGWASSRRPESGTGCLCEDPCVGCTCFQVPLFHAGPSHMGPPVGQGVWRSLISDLFHFCCFQEVARQLLKHADFWFGDPKRKWSKKLRWIYLKVIGIVTMPITKLRWRFRALLGFLTSWDTQTHWRCPLFSSNEARFQTTNAENQTLGFFFFKSFNFEGWSAHIYISMHVVARGFCWKPSSTIPNFIFWDGISLVNLELNDIATLAGQKALESHLSPNP